ncbi:MAG: head-tail adaptor protein [Solirubrobacterales bacterium]
MRAGKLRTPSIIVKPSEVSDFGMATGKEKEVWKGYAGIEPLQGDVRVQFQAEFAGVTHKVTIRRSPSYRPKSGHILITHDARRLKIRAVINEDERDAVSEMVAIEDVGSDDD